MKAWMLVGKMAGTWVARSELWLVVPWAVMRVVWKADKWARLWVEKLDDHSAAVRAELWVAVRAGWWVALSAFEKVEKWGSCGAVGLAVLRAVSKAER